MNRLATIAITALLGAVASLSGASVLAQEESEKIVISLQSDPLTNQEPACVALQLGTGLIVNGGADVTIFATLDGVGIANADVMGSPQLMRAPSKFCKTVNREGQLQDPVPLPQILQNYLKAGGEILACPLCWAIKFGDLPDSGADLIKYKDQVYIDSPVPLFIAADKVIDY